MSAISVAALALDRLLPPTIPRYRHSSRQVYHQIEKMNCVDNHAARESNLIDSARIPSHLFEHYVKPFTDLIQTR